MTKLSTAQVNLLAELLDGPRQVVRAYKPAGALIAARLAEDLTPDDDYSVRLKITDLGSRHPAIGAPKP